MRELAPGDVTLASSPLAGDLAGEVAQLVARLDATQRAWLSGYLAGTLRTLETPNPGPPAASREDEAVTILFGSQSGNGESLARRLGEVLSAKGVSCTTLDMLDCRKNHLLSARHLLVVVSTHGEGDPPDRAKPLYELLHGRKAPQLSHLKYSVLALGDSSYEKFCETGRHFDAQLAALGAQRLHERVECDVDFDAPASVWIAQVVERLVETLGASTPAVAAVTPRTSASIATAYTRKNPYAAQILVNQRLTGRESTKDVRHIELSIEGSGIHFEPGDALGVVPRNHAQDVSDLLEALPFDADTQVEIAGQASSLRDALMEHLDIGPLSQAMLERYAAATGDAALSERAANTDALELRGLHLIDLVSERPPRMLDAAQFVRTLRPLAPRLYSIASSARATPDEVHLTVSVVRYASQGRQRHGVVSALLAELTGESAVAQVYPNRNPSFRLPANQDAPIIMVGPGTGIAPFRGFLAEREASNARGRNWLFFGDRSFRNDFLYQTEWLEWRKRGVLHRIDVAFSRDCTEKIYVQRRMHEQGRELFAWLENGAHIYVCGDAQRMAPDVDRALHEIIAGHGGLDAERASEYVMNLQRERRYQKDVY
jgi:sulfite reductase (NADPH) flavoprotein alpha-component